MDIRWAAVILLGAIHTCTVQAADKIRVDVYLDRGSWTGPLGFSQGLASELFGRIDVQLKWHSGKVPESGRGSAVVIGMRFDQNVPESLSSSALASASPFGTSGTDIRIYHERVERFLNRIPSMADVLLAYIFAHEIGHVLYGTDFHADAGIMRATWTHSDNMDMLSRRLSFTQSDAVWIRKSASAKLLASR